MIAIIASYLMVASSINRPLWDLLVGSGLDRPHARKIISTLEGHVNFRHLTPGDSVYIEVKPESLYIFRLKKGYRIYEVILQDTLLRGFDIKEKFLSRRLELVEGVVKDNLYWSMTSIGEGPELVVRFADIFGWDIDFSVETENGDTFRLLVEKLYRGDRFAGYGRIYYAEYSGRRTGHRYAVYWKGAYYDLEGNSLQKMFLRSPLKVYRITSRFGRRFHPILRKWRMHHGVDYAAPIGTPVFSVGEGVVKFAGWRGGYGKLIIIRHPKGFETRYGHLSSIAVKPGQHVNQGQFIGRVGSTGLSTGPHLHFEVRQHGRLLNPLTLKLQPKEPIPREEMARFEEYVNKLRNFSIKIKETRR